MNKYVEETNQWDISLWHKLKYEDVRFLDYTYDVVLDQDAEIGYLRIVKGPHLEDTLYFECMQECLELLRSHMKDAATLHFEQRGA